MRRVSWLAPGTEIPQVVGMKSVRSLLGSSLFLFSLASASSLSACGSKDEPDSDKEPTGTGGAPTGGTTMVDPGTGGEMQIETGGTGGEGGGMNVLALPDLLSETGLYEADMETLAPGVRPFRPQFPLWTDDAKKRRWVKLPEGAQIDTSDMDYWQYPAGTKMWKEFVRDDVRVETRLLEKTEHGIWLMMAYQWRDDASDADAVPLGVMNASNTEHDIPSEVQCWQCHNQMPDRSLGFSAIQLAHDAGVDVPGDPEANEWTLAGLEAANLLTDTPPALVVPDSTDMTARPALGYLHGNCGHCHHPLSSVSGRVNMELRLTAEGIGTGDVTQTETYLTTVGVPVALADGPVELTHRIDPGSVATSAMHGRFNVKGADYSMPPLGTEIVDPDGEAVLRLWIESLNP